jgi:dTDP-4-amino-4,6-dideoxygalactose transaminase
VLYAIPARMPFLRLGETVYLEPHRALGMSGPAAAAARTSLELAKREVTIRRGHARWLRERLLDHPALRIVQALDAPAACLRLPVVVQNGEADHLARQGRNLGVARGYPMALADLPSLAARVPGDVSRMAGARALARGLVTLPTHSLVREPDRVRLVHWLWEGFAPTA